MLHETNHCTVAVRVKFIVVTRFNGAKGTNAALKRLAEWVFRKFRFYVITEVCNKS